MTVNSGPPDAQHPLTIVVNGSFTQVYTGGTMPAYTWGQHKLAPFQKTQNGTWFPQSGSFPHSYTDLLGYTHTVQWNETFTSGGILTIQINDVVQGISTRIATGALDFNTGSWNVTMNETTNGHHQNGEPYTSTINYVGTATLPIFTFLNYLVVKATSNDLPISSGFLMLPSGATTLSTKNIVLACRHALFNTVIPNCSLSISFDQLIHDGGHQHTASRPLLKLESPQCGNTSVSSVQCNSGVSGLVSIKVTAPQVSGVTRITGTGTGTVTQSPSMNPFTNNFELQSITAVTSPAGFRLELLSETPYLDLTGSRDNVHEINHYGTPYFNQAIYILAKKYDDDIRRKHPPHNDPAFPVNDMSLIFGGLFDYEGNWKNEPGHKLHRFGMDADIGSGYGTGMASIPVDNRPELRRAIYGLGLKVISEGKCKPNSNAKDPDCTHWHVKFNHVRTDLIELSR